MMKFRKLLWLLPLALLLASCSRDPKVQAERYLANGNKFFDKGKFKEASIMYRRALQKDLRFGEAYYRLALTELKLASYGDAVRALRRAVELQPNNTDAAAKLADIYIAAAIQDASHSAEMQKEAKELTDTLLQHDPNSFDGHRLAGQLALFSKDPATAVKELETAYRIKPQPEVAIALFQALASNSQVADAQKLAHEVIEKNKTYAPMYDLLYLSYIQDKNTSAAEEVMKLKVQNNPNQPAYLVQLAAHYFVNKQLDDMDKVVGRLTDEKTFPDGHMLAGDFFMFRARDYERARLQYEAGAREIPRDKAAYQRRLVELLAATGRNADANQMLAAILKDNPKDADAIAMRAALMLQTGNQDQINQATNDLQSLVTKTPDNHVLRYNLARAYIAKNQLDAARLQLEAAIKIRPDFLIAREMLGKIYLATGDSARALKEADETLKLNENDLQAHLIRSSSLLGVGDRDKARQELETINRLAPNNPDARYQMGFLAWQTKDYKEASQIFGDLYKSNPQELRGLVGMVETLASQNKMPEAIDFMKQAVDREPSRRDFKLALANLYVRDEKYDDAIAMFQQLLSTDPKSADLLFRLGETQRRKGDVNTAVDTFRRASQASPNDLRPLLQLGLLMDGTGRRDQAKPIYEQILKIQPDQPVALNNLAYIKAEEGVDLDEALTMAQRAYQKLPNSPNIKDTLGWIYIKKNLSDDAVRTFKELTSEQPANPSFHYHYGMALMQKGDRPSAKRELELALQDKPSRDDATQIKKLLAEN